MPAPKFRAKNQALQVHAIGVLKAERPMTLRALYYRLASAGHLPATDAGYNQLKRLTKALREAGQVPITGWIVDRVRSTLKPSSWSGLAEFGDTVRHAYRKNLWTDMKFPTNRGQPESGVNSDHEETHRWLANARSTRRSSSSRR